MHDTMKKFYLACRSSRLRVSEKTTKTHVKNAQVKFNLHGKSELWMALKEGDKER
jgi:DNA-binding CsgD family transcriptional regulator